MLRGLIDSVTASANGDNEREAVFMTVRIDVDAHIPSFVRAMSHLDNATTKELDRAGVEAPLRELVRLRASQLNGCAYCVDLHSRDACAAGETEQRLWAVAVWRESTLFSSRERAALAFTESVTLAALKPVADEDVAALGEHFSAEESAALLAVIVMINAWNALSVTSHAWTPASE